MMSVDSVLGAVAAQTGASVPALRLVLSVLLGKLKQHSRHII